MKVCLFREIFVMLLSMTLVAAASTKFVSTWKNPAFGLVDMDGKKIAAFIVSADDSMRLGPEETLAAEMRRRGIDCVAGYTVLPGELAKDQEQAKEFLARAGITGAVMMRVVSREKETRSAPGTAWYSAGYYPSFWGYWNYGWTAVYAPGYTRSDTIVSIETLVYSIERDQLVWAGMSETTNPRDVRKLARQLVDAAGKEMRKAGLVRK
jgi:hypothetical protein